MRLFLDDYRSPEHCLSYIASYGIRPDIYQEKWEVVRDYESFVKFIEENGLPEEVSFDHDLADIHYDPKTWTERFEYKEKTGYDCAVWLIEYCITNKKLLPRCYCHSMNPIGRERIRNLLKC